MSTVGRSPGSADQHLQKVETTGTRVVNPPECYNVVDQYKRDPQNFAILWKAIAVRGCKIQSSRCSPWEPSDTLKAALPPHEQLVVSAGFTSLVLHYHSSTAR